MFAKSVKSISGRPNTRAAALSTTNREFEAVLISANDQTWFGARMGTWMVYARNAFDALGEHGDLNKSRSKFFGIFSHQPMLSACLNITNMFWW
jgi:hypothetical protein